MLFVNYIMDKICASKNLIIKGYTDLSQSKKLAEILPLESADNVIVSFGSREGTKTVVMPKETLDVIRTPFADIRETTPCWSLSALINAVDFSTINLHYNNARTDWIVSATIHDSTKHCTKYEGKIALNPINACYEMIIKLKERNTI